jgi:hypothetical protein
MDLVPLKKNNLTLAHANGAAYFVARGDQHAGCASVIAADGRVLE